MPETPDFDQIALRLVTQKTAQAQVAIAEQLRLIWNARGAADIAKFDFAVAKQLEVREVPRTDLDLNAVCRALRSLDR